MLLSLLMLAVTRYRLLTLQATDYFRTQDSRGSIMQLGAAYGYILHEYSCAINNVLVKFVEEHESRRRSSLTSRILSFLNCIKWRLLLLVHSHAGSKCYRLQIQN